MKIIEISRLETIIYKLVSNIELDPKEKEKVDLIVKGKN